jgi:hypothetical protein
MKAASSKRLVVNRGSEVTIRLVTCKPLLSITLSHTVFLSHNHSVIVDYSRSIKVQMKRLISLSEFWFELHSVDLHWVKVPSVSTKCRSCLKVTILFFIFLSLLPLRLLFFFRPCCFQGTNLFFFMLRSRTLLISEVLSPAICRILYIRVFRKAFAYSPTLLFLYTSYFKHHKTIDLKMIRWALCLERQ